MYDGEALIAFDSSTDDEVASATMIPFSDML